MAEWVTLNENVLTENTEGVNGMSSQRTASHRGLINTASGREMETCLARGLELGRLSSAQNQPRSEVRNYNGLCRRTLRDSARARDASGLPGRHGSKHHHCEVKRVGANSTV